MSSEGESCLQLRGKGGSGRVGRRFGSRGRWIIMPLQHPHLQ